MSSRELKITEVHYPESDGKPMAETDIHRQLMVEAIESVAEHFRDDPAFYVSGNLFLYYEEGDPASVVSPDFFAVRGVPGRLRRTYKVWEEGKGPDIVLELTSQSTHREDLGNKARRLRGAGGQGVLHLRPRGDQVPAAAQGVSPEGWRPPARPGSPARGELPGLPERGPGSRAPWRRHDAPLGGPGHG